MGARPLIGAIGIATAMTVSGLTAQSADHVLSESWVGSEFQYVTITGDSWQRIGARYGIAPGVLATLNGRRPDSRLKAGDVVRVDSRHLVPRGGPQDGLTINVPQRMLYLRETGRIVAAYPVGLGRSGTPTFIGPFTVVVKEPDPVWDVPVSIQEELRRAGKPVLTRVLPGPTNPLGKYWLGLSGGAFGIHGTIAPLSIFRFQSHGCIRLHPDDIADLYPRVVEGAIGEVIYEPLLLVHTTEGLMLEAHPDVYRRASRDSAEALMRSVAARAGQRIDWDLVHAVLTVRDGRPHLVGRRMDVP